MEVIPYAVIGFIVLIVLVGIAVGAHRKEAAEETRDRLNQFAGFNCSDLYVSDHDASGIAVDAANKRLLVSGKSTPERVYDASQIMGVEIVKNGETVHTTNRGSQAVGVAVGAVLLGPLDEVEAVGVAALFDGSILGKSLGIEAGMFDGERVVDHQLRGNHRIDLGGITAVFGDRIAQSGHVDQGGGAENVLQDHAGREPGKIHVAAVLDQLRQGIVEQGWITTAHQIFGQNATGVRQAGIGTRLDGIHRSAGIEVPKLGSGKILAIGVVHVIPFAARQ